MTIPVISSLTPVIVDFYMYESQPLSYPRPATANKYLIHPSLSETNGIYVAGVRYSLSLNNVSEATVSLSFRGRSRGYDAEEASGLDTIQSIFPVGETLKKHYTGEIHFRGSFSGAKFTTVENSLFLYKGEVVGYGISTTVGDLTFDLTLRGFMSSIQQLNIATPGMHGATPHTLRLAPIGWTKDTAGYGDLAKQAASANDIVLLITALTQGADEKVKNGFDLFKWITDKYGEVLGKADLAPIVSDRVKTIYIDALNTFNGDSNGDPFDFWNQIEYDSDSSKLGDRDTFRRLMGYISRVYMNNPHMSFWTLLLSILETFGLNIVDYGVGIVGFPKAPLLSGADVFNTINYIRKEDASNLQISDAPYQNPTRVVVTTDDYVAQWTNSKMGVLYGRYPTEKQVKNNKTLAAEEARGPRVLFYNAPMFFASYIHNETEAITKKLKEKDGTTGEGKKNNGEKDTETTTQENDARRKLLDEYAKYIYMCRKFDTRTGIVNTRFMPNIFPGLPCIIEDPTRLVTLEAQVIGVSHNIDCNNRSASTSVTLNHIRYKKDIDPYPFENVFYPNNDLSKVENIIVKNTFVEDPWNRWMTNAGAKNVLENYTRKGI